MKDFVSLNIHHDIPYSLDKYMSYDHLSQKYRAYVAAMSNITEPKSYNEAVKDLRWVLAMNEEIQALELNKTWNVMALPADKSVIGYQWIYKIKYKVSGENDRFKERLVAKEFIQNEGIDYQKIFYLR